MPVPLADLPWLQVLRRAATLFLLGVALQGGVPGHFATYDFYSIRIMGVLQRIAGTPEAADTPAGLYVAFGALDGPKKESLERIRLFLCSILCSPL